MIGECECPPEGHAPGCEVDHGILATLNRRGAAQPDAPTLKERLQFESTDRWVEIIDAWLAERGRAEATPCYHCEEGAPCEIHRPNEGQPKIRHPLEVYRASHHICDAFQAKYPISISDAVRSIVEDEIDAAIVSALEDRRESPQPDADIVRRLRHELWQRVVRWEGGRLRCCLCLSSWYGGVASEKHAEGCILGDTFRASPSSGKRKEGS